MINVLFRAKRAADGAWIKGRTLVQINNPSGELECFLGETGHHIGVEVDDIGNIESIENASLYKVMPETVGRYTGQRDMHGTDIFEGDILDVTGTIVKVDWAHTSFKLTRKNNRAMTWTIVPRAKIIGNIFENPELWEGKK